MIFLLLILSCFISSTLLTGCLRRYVLSRNILDLPNHRSSHVTPTPRGGGVAFVIIFFLAILCLASAGLTNLPVAIALLSGGSIVASVGFIDDHKHVPAYLRFVAHMMAGFIAIFLIGGMPSLSVSGLLIPAGIGLSFLALVYLVWLINLYNFMDGIDGIAALETITVCSGASILYIMTGEQGLIGLPLALAASVAGFLWWNFPTARIFMGDVGSGFLGFTLGILTIQAAGISDDLFLGWLILLGVFIVDATITLLMRLFQGKKITEGHCEHAYQHAAKRYGSHRKVTIAVCIVNIFWLLPMAILVISHVLQGFLGLIVAYIPLVILAVIHRAGHSQLS